MPHALLERGLDHPHPVQLIARQVAAEELRLDDFIDLVRRRVDPVRVVGHVHLLLAGQLPVVAV
ncbi:hypothetical protein D3C87_2083990 [compost metagenome]